MALRSTIFLPFLLSMSVASTAAPRAPAGGWTVQFDDAQCVARRLYGSAEEPIHLVLKAPPLGDVMQVAVIRKARWGPPNQVEATIGVDSQPPLKTSMLRFYSKESGLGVYTLNMPAANFQMVRGAKTLSVRASGFAEGFELSQLEPLLKVMGECVSDLRRVWNVTDPSREGSPLTSRATADLASLLDNTDYPEVALAKGQSGAVRFVVLIDETGRVADCTVVETSGVPALDAQSCALVKSRAKFKPAVGRDGKPAKDAVVTSLRWVLAS